MKYITKLDSTLSYVTTVHVDCPQAKNDAIGISDMATIFCSSSKCIFDGMVVKKYTAIIRANDTVIKQNVRMEILANWTFFLEYTFLKEIMLLKRINKHGTIISTTILGIDSIYGTKNGGKLGQ